MMLRGYAVGLVHLMSASSYPPGLARNLLLEVLDSCREAGLGYLGVLTECCDQVRGQGYSDLASLFETEIHDVHHCRELPRRWHLDQIFSVEAFERYGLNIVYLWSEVLIALHLLAEYWHRRANGYPVHDPHLLPGFPRRPGGGVVGLGRRLPANFGVEKS